MQQATLADAASKGQYSRFCQGGAGERSDGAVAFQPLLLAAAFEFPQALPQS
jgi:hypothetical protein